MAQYIDKAAVVAWIKSRIQTEQGYSTGEAEHGYKDCGEEILSFLDTLEVKDVDLEKEINDMWSPRFNLGWDENSLLSINHDGFTYIAKHFFEIGLKAQKGYQYAKEAGRKDALEEAASVQDS